MSKLHLLLSMVSALGCLSATCDAQAASFESKRIEMTVGFGVGGTPDMAARMAARHLGRFIPGNPSVVVVNRPGAEGVTQTSYMANLAPKDGSSIGYISRASALQQIAGRPGVRFDLAEFQWLGGFSQQNIVVFVRRDTGITSLDELRTAAKPIAFAIRAPGGTDFLAAKALEALDIPLHIVSGYGSSQTTMAFERGEIDGSAFTQAGLRQRPDWLKPGGLVVQLVEFGSIRPESITYGPDLKPMPGKEGIYALINQALGLPVGAFAGPPAMDSGVAKTLEQAFAQMAGDPSFLDDARKADIEVNPISAADLKKVFADFLHAPDEIRQEFTLLVQ